MAIYHCDLESYSTIDLKKVGSYRYARHPETDVLCACWSKDEGPVQSWTPGSHNRIVLQPGDKVTGYNIVGFDAEIWRWILAPRYGWIWPGYEVFLDAMARAAYANLPGALGEVAKALGTKDKDAVGARLMMRLCKPAHTIMSDPDPRRLHSPQNLQRLLAYCGEDVEAERALLPRLPELPVMEQKVFTCTALMNQRGIAVDLPLVDRMMALSGIHTEALRSRMASATRGAIESENQLAAITRYARSRGLNVPDGKGAMNAEAIDKYLDGELDPTVRLVLETRRQLGRSALAKLQRLKDATCEDGRVRGLIQYYGAHQTGRDAGRLVQIQNLPRGVLKGAAGYLGALETVRFNSPAQAYDMLGLCYGIDALPDVLSSLIRPCFIASPGNVLHVCDYNAIEARVLAWLAGETRVIEGFRQGLDPYKVMASAIYHVTYEAVTAAQRAIGKAVVLGCGYGLGWKKFIDYCANMNIAITEEEAQGIVKAFRDRCPNIKNFWYACDDAAVWCVLNPGMVKHIQNVAFRFDGNHLKIRLPSGRCLWYRNAFIIKKPVPWSDKPKDAVAFYGEQTNGNWGVSDTYGGKIVENISQAVARDIMADAAVRCEDLGIPIVARVHDELVADTDSRDPHLLEHVMATLPAWAEGLPMRSEEFISPFYRK